MYKKYLLGYKALIKNSEGRYLQLGQNSLRGNTGVDRMLPGGRVEEGEGFGDVLQREVFEETAYEIDQKDLRYRGTFVTTIKLTNQQDSTQDYGLVLSYYEYSMNKDNDPILSDEHQQRRRVTLDVIQESLQGIVADTEYISFL